MIQGKGLTSRRAFLKSTAMGATALGTGAMAQVLGGNRNDVWIRLTSAQELYPILPGQQSTVFRYRAALRHGPRGSVINNRSSFLGPTFVFNKGQRVQFDYVNQLSESSVVHFHGMNVPEQADGHPRFAIGPGQVYSTQFEVIDRAGTYWYHPHPDMRTGFQVVRGLAGMVIVHDEEEAALDLPRGACDQVFVIQDKRFNSQNQIQHSTGSQSGYIGNRILVNGIPDYTWNCSTRLYRVRVLNGSNSRIYKLAWSDGQPMHVIGTTGGLLPTMETRPYVMLGPGQRLELILDCTTKSVNDEFKLVSLEFPMAGPGSGSPPNGTAMDIMTMRVAYVSPESVSIPSVLTPIDYFRKEDAVNANNSRVFASEYMDGMWTINGRVFEMTGVAEEEKVRLGDLELWELRNLANLDQVQVHPMHLHGAQFQVHKRWMDEDFEWYDHIREGYVDQGWQDTALLFPGERCEILLKHGPYPGLFLMHCHNLEHEDMGMMRNFLIEN